MFALQPKPTFKAEVVIPTTGGDGKFTVEFKHKGRKALQAFFASLVAGGEAREDVDALDELIVGWEGIDQKYSKEGLDTLLDNYPGAGKALFDAYQKALLEGQVKN